MTDYLSPIALAYTLIKDTIIIANRRPEIIRKREFQQKIIFIQKSMIEVINNGQKIFDFIKVVNKSDTSENPELIRNIKFLASSQIRSIEKLSQSLSDKTWSKMFALLMPDLRRHVHDPMFLKGKRLRLLLRVDNFDYKELRKLYNEAYLQKGEEIIEELRRTADEVAQIIRAKIPLEDL
jgi:hypothetical protein